MKKIRASKLELREVEKKEEADFLNKYHYQKYTPSNICYGLYQGDELIILMTFGIPRYNKKYDWELLRLCTKKDYQVLGGASRLLKHFTENYDGSIVSYCNESKFNGGVYKALGFSYQGNCKSYHYEKNGKTYHRSNFTRARLEKLYPQYSRQDYTEKMIMELEGFTRIEEKQGTWVLNDKSRWYIYEIECNGYHYIGQHRYWPGRYDNYITGGTIIKREIEHHPYKKIILYDNIKTSAEANKYEKCLIRISRALYGEINKGGKNCNIDEGGTHAYARKNVSVQQGIHRSGLPKGTKLKLSDEERKARSERRIERNKTNPNHAWLGKHLPDDMKKKISEGHKGIEPSNKDKRTKDEIELQLLNIVKNKPKPILTGKPDADACILKMREVEDKINADGYFTRKQLYSVMSPHKLYRDYELVYKIGQTGAFKHK